MTEAEYRERKVIDTDYMAALAVLDTEYQSLRRPFDKNYNDNYDLLEQMLVPGGSRTQFKVLTSAYNALIAPLASAYIAKIESANRVYFACIRAFDTRFSN